MHEWINKYKPSAEATLKFNLMIRGLIKCNSQNFPGANQKDIYNY